MRIYMTINKTNGKMYVGRDSRRCDDYLGSGVLLLQAIKKHGKESFVKIVLEDLGVNAELRDAIDCEKKWIEIFQAPTNSMFYNLSWDTGGMGKGDKHSNETKKRISDIMKNEVYKNGLSPEWKENVANAVVGRIPWNKGKNIRIERPEMCKRRKHQKLNEEQQQQIRDLHSEGVPAYKIGEKFDVSHHVILRIVRDDGMPKQKRIVTEESKRLCSESLKSYWANKKAQEVSHA